MDYGAAKLCCLFHVLTKILNFMYRYLLLKTLWTKQWALYPALQLLFNICHKLYKLLVSTMFLNSLIPFQQAVKSTLNINRNLQHTLFYYLFKLMHSYHKQSVPGRFDHCTPNWQTPPVVAIHIIRCSIWIHYFNKLPAFICYPILTNYYNS